MHVHKLSIVALLGLTLFAGEVHAQRSTIVGDALPTQRLLARYGLERVWWSQATLDPQRDTVRHIVMDEDNLYIQSTAGIVTAFDSETGQRLWSNQFGRTDEPSEPVASNETQALIVAGTTVYAVEKRSGELLWKFRLPGAPTSPPTVDEKQLYIGTLDGSMYAFDLQRIREFYENNLLPAWSRQTQNWRYKTGRRVTAPAISTGKVVCFASQDGSLYSVTADERELQFQFETDAPVSAPLAQSEDYIFLVSQDFRFYCIHRLTGNVRWEFITGQPVRSAPQLIGEDVFVLPDRAGMYRMTASSGRQLWWRPEPTQFLAATPNLVFAGDEFDNVLLLERSEGTPIGVLPLRRFSVRRPNPRTDRLYLSTPSGLVVCIREKGREFPLYHMYPERRPILPEFAPEPTETSDDAEPSPAAAN